MKRNPLSWRRRAASAAGFTLVEILVVVVILSVLAALLIPAAGRVMEKARLGKCMSNLKQWGLACRLYANDNNGALPSALANGEPNWQESIAPYLVPGQGAPGQLRFVLRETLTCPNDKKKSEVWGYGLNNYMKPELNANAPRTFQTLDHPATTLLLGESESGGLWNTLPWNGRSGVNYERHGGTANFIFADLHGEAMNPAQAAARGAIVVLP